MKKKLTDEERKELRRLALARYSKSDKRKATSKRYRATEKGKHDLKHRHTPERKAYLRARDQQPDVKAARRVYASKPASKEIKYFHSLKRFYKMTVEEYKILLEKQNSACAICSDIPTYRLAVDHNHSTGVVRGLLCRKCNLGIGFLKDNVEFLAIAIKYLS